MALNRSSLEGEDQDHDEHQDRHDLGDGDDAVDDGGLLDAAQDHEVEQPDADRGDDDRHHRVAVAEHREERAERRLDQHPVGDVADAAADPVAEGRQEARIVAEARLRVGEDAGVEVGLALGQRLEHAGQHVHAGAAMIQAMTAPIGPVALAKVRGSEKMPAPTMPPTTMAVSANSESFCTAVVLTEPPLGEGVAAT